MTVINLKCDPGTSQEAFGEMYRLQSMGILCDLEIKTSTDHVFKVHKIVMVATCSYFQDLLLSSTLHNQVVFSNLDHTTLGYVIKFVYGEEITPTDTQILYQVAKELGVSDLIKKCEDIATNLKSVHDSETIVPEDLTPGNLKDTPEEKLEIQSSFSVRTAETSPSLIKISENQVVGTKINNCQPAASSNVSKVDLQCRVLVERCDKILKSPVRKKTESQLPNNGSFQDRNNVALPAMKKLASQMSKVVTQFQKYRANNFATGQSNITLWCKECGSFFKTEKSRYTHMRFRHPSVLKQHYPHCSKCNKIFLNVAESEKHHCLNDVKQKTDGESFTQNGFEGTGITSSESVVQDEKNKLSASEINLLQDIMEVEDSDDNINDTNLEQKEKQDGVYMTNASIQPGSKRLKNKTGSNKVGKLSDVKKAKRNTLKKTKHKHGMSTARKKYVCPICELPMPKREIPVHKVYVHNVGTAFAKKMSCDMCDEKFMFRELMCYHYKQNHKCTLIVCNEKNCDGFFKSKGKYQNHRITVHGEAVDRLSCEICGETFKKQYLKSHLRLVHGSGIECKVCGERIIGEKIKLWRHELREHGIVHEDKLFKCSNEDCNFKAYTGFEVQKHQRTHLPDRCLNFSCDVCGKTFRAKEYLKNHQLLHNNPNQFLCNRCGKTMNGPNRFIAHMRTCGVEQKRFKCSICNYSTVDRFQVKRHEFRRHRIIRKDLASRILTCEICGFQVLAKSLLLSHMKSHTKPRDNCCEKCGKGFNSKCNLKQHIQQMHSNEHNIFCPHCPYKSASKNNVKDHIRIKHQLKGFKPFKCFYCAHCSALRSNCIKHITRNHPGKEEICHQILDLETGKPISPKRTYGLHDRPNVTTLVQDDNTKKIKTLNRLDSTSLPYRMVSQDKNLDQPTTVPSGEDDERLCTMDDK